MDVHILFGASSGRRITCLRRTLARVMWALVVTVSGAFSLTLAGGQEPDAGKEAPARVAAGEDKSAPPTLTIKAMIDGRDDVRITREGIEWVHRAGKWPASVALNGRAWDPKKQPRLTGNDLKPYLPDGFVFGPSELASRQGRGAILLRSESADSVTIEFNDEAAGADLYRAAIRFRSIPWLTTGAPRVPKPKARDAFTGDVRITATVDGTDELLIFRDAAEWRHHSDQWPTGVRINGVEWSPKDGQRLPNAEATAFMPDYTVLVGATHWKMRGRGEVRFEVETDHLKVTFIDGDPGADTYEIVIHQGEIFPEIEVSDDNAQRVADLFAKSPQTPHPDGKDQPPNRNLNAIRREWRHGRLTQAYEQFGYRDPKWDEAARAYLVRSEPFPEQEPADKMLEAGDKLVEAGCNDPLFCMIHGFQLARVNRLAEAERFALHSVLEFEKSKYPARARRIAPALLARLYMMQSANRSDQAYALVQRSLEETLETVRGPLAGEERRALLAEIRHGLDRQAGGLFVDQKAALMRMLSDSPDADPWVVHMLLSDYQYDQGWEARGGGWAAGVTDDGWQVFRSLLAQSKAHRVAAWAAHPDFPEGAQGMIMITRAVGGVGEETPRFWFDQAVAAQFDAPGAHEWLMWALRPRWGGSHQEMLDFGMECLRTGRFDSEVPEIFFHAIYGIYGEGGDLPSLVGPLDADDEIRRGIVEIENAQTGDRKQAMITRNMIFGWLMDWRDEARRRMDELKGQFHAGVERDWNLSGNFIRYDLLNPLASPAAAPAIESLGTLFENRGPIGAFAVAPDGEQIAVRSTGDDEQKLTIWNVATGKPQEIRPGKPMDIYRLDFSADSKRLAALQYESGAQRSQGASAIGQLALWKTGAEGTSDLALPGDKTVNSFAWLPDGKSLAVGTPHRVVIVDAETAREVASTPRQRAWVTAVGVSAADRLLAVGFFDGPVQFYRLPNAADVAAAKQPLTLIYQDSLRKHVGQIDYLEFSRDGKSLASSSGADRSVWIWDVPAKEARHRLPGWQIAFSPDGGKLATAGGPFLRQEAVVWDVKSGKAARRCAFAGDAALVGVAFTPDGEFLIAPTRSGAIFTWKATD